MSRVTVVDNDVVSTGVYHKMGQKGVPAMHLTMGSNDNTIGYLLGEPHQGLPYMFQMMNEARIGVGMTAAAIATAAYYAALQYARERPQSRRLNQKNRLDAPQTPIINHPDVRRMLLFQKSVTEGCLVAYCSKPPGFTILVKWPKVKKRKTPSCCSIC